MRRYTVKELVDNPELVGIYARCTAKISGVPGIHNGLVVVTHGSIGTRQVLFISSRSFLVPDDKGYGKKLAIPTAMRLLIGAGDYVEF